MRAFTLGSCLAATVTLAFTANLLLEAWLRPPPPQPELRPPRAEVSPPALDPGGLSRALGTPLRPRSIAAPTRPLPLTLLGTLDDHAAAMVEASSGRCRTLRVGDRWSDVELVAVGHGRVTVRREGGLEELGLGAPAVTPAATPAVPGPSRLAIALSPRGARLSMPRAELERQLPELTERALAGGRIVPAFEGGTLTGFRLLAVRPGSLYEELGLKSGDVLESVNGASLSNPSVALGLLSGLRDQRQVALVVNRGGQRLMWELSLN